VRRHLLLGEGSGSFSRGDIDNANLRVVDSCISGFAPARRETDVFHPDFGSQAKKFFTRTCVPDAQIPPIPGSEDGSVRRKTKTGRALLDLQVMERLEFKNRSILIRNFLEGLFLAVNNPENEERRLDHISKASKSHG
jgi:hypothetical protein